VGENHFHIDRRTLVGGLGVALFGLSVGTGRAESSVEVRVMSETEPLLTGKRVAYEIVLDDVTDGIGAFAFEFSLDGNAAKFDDIEIDDEPQFLETTVEDDSLQLEGATGAEEYQPEGNTLGTVWVNGLQEGETELGIEQAEISDSDNEHYTVDAEGVSVEVVDPDSATMDIEQFDIDTPVEAGEQLTATLDLSNPSPLSVERTVTVDIDGIDEQEVSVALDQEETTTETIAFSTGDGGTYTATADTGDEDTSKEVRVLRPPSFTIDDIDVEKTIDAGETLSPAVTVKNAGDQSGTTTLTATIDGIGSDETNAEIAEGESTEFSLSIPTGDGGIYALVVETNDDEDVREIAVQDSGEDESEQDEQSSQTDRLEDEDEQTDAGDDDESVNGEEQTADDDQEDDHSGEQTADETANESAINESTGDELADDSGPGFTIPVALASAGGLGYVLSRFTKTTDESVTGDSQH